MSAINYILKSTAQLNVTIADLDDNNTGLSFLFYSVCQSNTLDFKGEKSEVLKRLVGSKLFPLVPMARFKKAGQDKAVYQYNRKGSAQMALELDDLGFGSIAEMLDVETDVSADYYPEFAAKVEDWIAAKDAEKKAANKAKKEAEKAETETEAEVEAELVQSKMVRAENLGITVAELDQCIAILEKRAKAIELLIELGQAEMVETLQAQQWEGLNQINDSREII